MATCEAITDSDLIQWCEYARGVVDPIRARQLRRRLGRSPGARRSVELFERVSSVARRDREARLPAYAVRVVKAVAGLRRGDEREARSGLSTLRFLPFTVVFDSQQIAPAGTRGSASPEQRITSYRAGQYRVHVRLEQETNPHGQVVVGQLLRHGPEPRPVSGVPVLVLADRRAVGRSLTTRFGEFQADGLPPGPLDLCLLVGPEECIELPLGALSEAA